MEWEGFIKIAHLSTIRGNPDEELLEAFRRFDKAHTGMYVQANMPFATITN